MRPIRCGISTCPNDTFLFCGLLTGAVRPEGFEIDFTLTDVQELNERLRAGDLDIAKVSYAAALEMTVAHLVLPVGSALGFGNGPLLLAARPDRMPRPGDLVLAPGASTTAHLLYRIFFGSNAAEVRQVTFDRIMPALEAGEADFGVCIHEGRFTYRDRGLHLVADLGALWEQAAHSPLPLGGLLARADLPPRVVDGFVEAARRSLDGARRDPAATLITMRTHARELSDDVIRAHVDLYVNEFTADLGSVGRAAIQEFHRRSGSAGPAFTFA